MNTKIMYFQGHFSRQQLKDKLDCFQMEAINVSDLKKDKCFQKLVRKFQKDMNELKKRHQKQRESVQKQQVTTCFSHRYQINFSHHYY